MTRNLVFVSFFIFNLACTLKGQMGDRLWLMLGAEGIHGSYTGISPQVMDDKYKLYNLATFRIESMGPKKGNFCFDWTGLGIAAFAIQNNRSHTSTYTENGFHKFENHYIMRLNGFRPLGDVQSKSLRFGFGWQADWRIFGAMKNDDDNGVGSYAYPGISYGPLEGKGRVSGGVNFNLVQQIDWLYSRYSLNLAYSPGKIQAVSIFPEGTWYVSYKRTAIFVNASYRADYLMGNRMTLAKGYLQEPRKKSSFALATHIQVGIALDIWKWGKRGA